MKLNEIKIGVPIYNARERRLFYPMKQDDEWYTFYGFYFSGKTGSWTTGVAIELDRNAERFRPPTKKDYNSLSGFKFSDVICCVFEW